ncbi:hypothetical protein JYU34_022902, partial [Plutella xylostella]
DPFLQHPVLADDEAYSPERPHWSDTSLAVAGTGPALPRRMRARTKTAHTALLRLHGVSPRPPDPLITTSNVGV